MEPARLRKTRCLIDAPAFDKGLEVDGAWCRMANISGSSPLKMALGAEAALGRGYLGACDAWSGTEAVREEAALLLIIPSFPWTLTGLSPLHGKHKKSGFAPRDLGLKSWQFGHTARGQCFPSPGPVSVPRIPNKGGGQLINFKNP